MCVLRGDGRFGLGRASDGVRHGWQVVPDSQPLLTLLTAYLFAARWPHGLANQSRRRWTNASNMVLLCRLRRSWYGGEKQSCRKDVMLARDLGQRFPRRYAPLFCFVCPTTVITRFGIRSEEKTPRHHQEPCF